MPKVTVLIAVLNGAQTIGRAIASAQGQVEKDIEILVVDDGSTDNTVETVKSMAVHDSRIRLLSMEKNQGAAAASNAGIAEALGEWIAILDCDDWWEPERLEVLLAAAQFAHADVVCDNLKIFDHMRNAIVEKTRFCSCDKPFTLAPETYFKHDNPLRRHSIGYIQPMTRKDFLVKHGIKYDTSHRYGFDFIYVAELLLHKAKLVIVPQAMYVYVHRISPTTRKRSPHSRSEAGHKMIVRGCTELLNKYGSSMTKGERQALIERRKIFEARVKCDDLIAAIHDYHMLEALRLLLQTPFMIVLISATVAKVVYANILNFKVILNKYCKFIAIPSVATNLA